MSNTDATTASPFTITFPTIEAALAHLGQGVLGAGIVIKAPPATAPAATPEHTFRPLLDGELILITDEWFFGGEGLWYPRTSVKPGERLCLTTDGGTHTPHRRVVDTTPTPEPNPGSVTSLIKQRDAWIETAAHQVTEINELKRAQTRWEAVCRQKEADMDKLLEALTSQEMTTEEARREREDAVKDALAQREEAKRLAAMLDKCQSGNRSLTAERDTLAEWKRQGLLIFAKWYKVEDYIRQHPDAILGDFIADTVLKWLKERDELKAAKATYRLLKVGEVIVEGDEFRCIVKGSYTWEPVYSTAVGQGLYPENVGNFRRKIIPA